MAFEIECEDKGLYCQLHGSVSISEIVQSIERETADQRYPSARYRLTDFLQVREHNVTIADAEGLATLDSARKALNPDLRDAIVVTDPLITTLVHHWIAVNERPELIRVFSSLSGARAWLCEVI